MPVAYLDWGVTLARGEARRGQTDLSRNSQGRKSQDRLANLMRLIVLFSRDSRVADQIHRDALDGIGRHRGAGTYGPDRIHNSRGTLLGRNTSLPHQRAVRSRASQESWSQLQEEERFLPSLALFPQPHFFRSCSLGPTDQRQSGFALVSFVAPVAAQPRKPLSQSILWFSLISHTMNRQTYTLVAR